MHCAKLLSEATCPSLQSDEDGNLPLSRGERCERFADDGAERTRGIERLHRATANARRGQEIARFDWRARRLDAAPDASGESNRLLRCLAFASPEHETWLAIACARDHAGNR